MIPKIIHYTWFSEDPFPATVEKCIASWHQHMPDWEYMLWDAERIKDIDSVWLKECLQEHKWAFAADYIRVYAVARYGGIYLDTDCHVLRSFDDLLSNKAFIGKEWMIHDEDLYTAQYLTSHCFGAEAGHPFILHCLDYYTQRHFITSTDASLPDILRLDMRLMPKVQCELARTFGYDPNPCSDEQLLQDGLKVYPSFAFNPCRDFSRSYCVHLCLGSWRPYRQKKSEKITLGYRIRYHLDDWLMRLMDRCGYVIFKKRK